MQTRTEYGVKLKNVVKAEGGENRTEIEGFAATTHTDKGQDQFTLEALRSMADQINEDARQMDVSAVFPEMDDMEESQIGNLNHNNNPAAEELIGNGDTRTVPVFKIVEAEVQQLNDGEYGLHITAQMLPLPDDYEEAVKGQIKEGALHSFSIEFSTSPDDVDFKMKDDGEPVRQILDARAEGVALTGRPMNDNASMTNAELKAAVADLKALEDVDLTPPDRVVEAAEAALDAKEEFSDELGDCGTGVGEDRAQRIIDDDLRPQDFLGGENTAYPDYLDSHSEDMEGIEGTPGDFSREEWLGMTSEDDEPRCGVVQYVLWGFYLDWFEEKQQELQDAMEDEETKTEDQDREMKPFAGFDDFDDCMSTMEEDGATTEEAEQICGSLQAEYKNAMSDIKEKHDDEEMNSENMDEEMNGEDEMNGEYTEGDQSGMKAEIPVSSDMQLLYPTEEMAMEAGSAMGLEGVHAHMLDGDEFYMPGEDHETFMEEVAGLEEDMNSMHGEDEEMKAAVGEWVNREWQGGTVPGKVIDRGESFTVSGNTIEGEEGEEDVLLMREWDEDDWGSRIAVPEDSATEIDAPESYDDTELPDADQDRETKTNVRGDSTISDDVEETEQETQDETPEGGEGAEEDVELKSELADLKEKVTELKTEKEDLEDELRDMKTLEGVKSEINEIKSELEGSDEDLEGERPKTEQNQSRDVKTGQDKAQWKKSIDQQDLGSEDLKSVAGSSGKTHAEVFAEVHGVDETEVINYAE